MRSNGGSGPDRQAAVTLNPTIFGTPPCHSTTARKIRGNLTLDTRDAIREGGDTGPAVVPGNPNKSLLLRALRHQGDLKTMPPKIW